MTVQHKTLASMFVANTGIILYGTQTGSSLNERKVPQRDIVQKDCVKFNSGKQLRSQSFPQRLSLREKPWQPG